MPSFGWSCRVSGPRKRFTRSMIASPAWSSASNVSFRTWSSVNSRRHSPTASSISRPASGSAAVWRNGRRLLVAPGRARADLAVAAGAVERDALRKELAQVRAERDELRAAITEMLATRRAHEMAKAELVRLYRERNIERAR